MKIPSSESSYSELSDFIQREFIQRNCTCRYSNRLWRKIQNNPVTTKGIESLKAQGFRLYFGDKYPDFYGVCDFHNKELWIRPDPDSYSEDKSICHETVHAYYGKISIDGTYIRRLSVADSWIAKINKEAIVEYIARQIRATPSLLEAIWSTFDIQPRVYDRSSLLAMEIRNQKKGQLIFPSVSDLLDETFMSTLMD